MLPSEAVVASSSSSNQTTEQADSLISNNGNKEPSPALKEPVVVEEDSSMTEKEPIVHSQEVFTIKEKDIAFNEQDYFEQMECQPESKKQHPDPIGEEESTDAHYFHVDKSVKKRCAQKRLKQALKRKSAEDVAIGPVKYYARRFGSNDDANPTEPQIPRIKKEEPVAVSAALINQQQWASSGPLVLDLPSSSTPSTSSQQIEIQKEAKRRAPVQIQTEPPLKNAVPVEEMTPLPNRYFQRRATLTPEKAGFLSLCAPCAKCNHYFKTSKLLNDHLGRHQEVGNVKGQLENCTLYCPVKGCNAGCDSIATVMQHLKKKHSISDFLCEHIEFENITDFKLWLSEFERLTMAKYLKTSTRYLHKCKSTYYLCHHIGKLRCGSRKSKKVGSTCTAFLHIKEYEDGTVLLRGCMKHTGHRQDVRMLPISDDIKMEIAKLLSAGLNANEVCEKMKKISDFNNRRYHLVPYEVRNVLKKLQDFKEEYIRKTEAQEEPPRLDVFFAGKQDLPIFPSVKSRLARSHFPTTEEPIEEPYQLTVNDSDREDDGESDGYEGEVVEAIGDEINKEARERAEKVAKEIERRRPRYYFDTVYQQPPIQFSILKKKKTPVKTRKRLYQKKRITFAHGFHCTYYYEPVDQDASSTAAKAPTSISAPSTCALAPISAPVSTPGPSSSTPSLPSPSQNATTSSGITSKPSEELVIKRQTPPIDYNYKYPGDFNFSLFSSGPITRHTPLASPTPTPVKEPLGYLDRYAEEEDIQLTNDDELEYPYTNFLNLSEQLEAAHILFSSDFDDQEETTTTATDRNLFEDFEQDV